MLLDSKADILLYGNAERALVELTHGLAQGKTIEDMRHLRGTAVAAKGVPAGWYQIDSTEVDMPGQITQEPDPYQDTTQTPDCKLNDEPAAEPDAPQAIKFIPRTTKLPRDKTVIRLPSYEQVKSDPVLYSHASRVLHLESNPGNARALIQQHGNRYVWINPPPIPLETPEMDGVRGCPISGFRTLSMATPDFTAYDMIKFGVNIMRGCFGGCTFCSITEHEGRIIQNRSEQSILKEVEAIRDTTPGFHRNHLGFGWPDRQRNPREELPQVVLYLSGHLRELAYRSDAAG